MIVTVTLNPSLDKTLRIPRLEHGALNRVQVVRLDVGGKGFNVSRALLALGTSSLAFGVVAGGTGQTLADGLRTLGIEAELVWVEGETRSNITLYESDPGLYTKINEPGPTLVVDDIREILARIQRRVRPGDLWIFCGSLPPGAPTDFYAQLIRLVRQADAYAALDTSGDALRAGVKATPFLIKPNVDEAEALLGRPITSLDEQVAAVRELQSRGIEIVALTRGEAGALLASRSGIVEAIPPMVATGSPIGAGDAFLAGLAYAWSQGAGLVEMAQWATACGTATAAQEGTGVGRRGDVERLLSQVRISHISDVNPDARRRL
ncbi:MAG: 1-phosphofructokinase [Anaerolineae bacterium]|nr:1-phosphofructokinase [Anaerolineae bacterium]